jgi:hypothetical protein
MWIVLSLFRFDIVVDVFRRFRRSSCSDLGAVALRFGGCIAVFRLPNEFSSARCLIELVDRIEQLTMGNLREEGQIANVVKWKRSKSYSAKGCNVPSRLDWVHEH